MYFILKGTEINPSHVVCIIPKRISTIILFIFEKKVVYGFFGLIWNIKSSNNNALNYSGDTS